MRTRDRGVALRAALVVATAFVCACGAPPPPPFFVASSQIAGPWMRNTEVEAAIRRLVTRAELTTAETASARQAREDIRFLDEFLAPSSIVIGADGRFRLRAAGTPMSDGTVKMVVPGAPNVVVLGDLALAVYQSRATLGGPLSGTSDRAYFEHVVVLQSQNGRFHELAKLSLRLVPSPGPDPWNPDYWDWRFAPKVPPPPVVTMSDDDEAEVGDARVRRDVLELVQRLQPIGVVTRSNAEKLADLQFLTSLLAADNAYIEPDGRFEHLTPAGTSPAITTTAFDKTFDGINIASFENVAVATWRTSVTLGSTRYYRSMCVFARRENRWQIVAGFDFRLLPEPPRSL